MGFFVVGFWFWYFLPKGRWVDLTSQTRDPALCPLQWEAQSPNHWAAKGSPVSRSSFLYRISSCCTVEYGNVLMEEAEEVVT